MTEILNKLTDSEVEDDCVIFKGSPLYNSLLQSGCLAEELDVEQKRSGISPAAGTGETSSQQDTQTKYACSLRGTPLGKRLTYWWKELASWLLPKLSATYSDHQQNIIKDLYASSCLEEDDRDFLHLYIQTTCKSTVVHAKHCRISKLCVEAIPCLLALCCFQYMNWAVPGHQSTWSVVVLATLAPIIALETFCALWKYRHRRKCNKELAIYAYFLKRNENLSSLMKKCLRMIQETELISRGFTLVSQRNPLSRLEGGQKDTSTRQCPVLRKLVFSVAREAVLFYRDMIVKLFESHPLTVDQDIRGSYLAYEAIQNYGPCLQLSMDDTDELHTITDGFTVSALKGINHLFSLHQSEFIKALILVQHEKSNKGIMDVEELQLLKSTSAQLEEWTVFLQKSHDYHSCAWMNREPVIRTTRTQSDVEEIYIAVHSLDLHLQAALTRVKYLGEVIQNIPDTNQSGVQIDDLLNQMQPIRAELESCKGCWEEGVSRIGKAAGRGPSKGNKNYATDEATEIDKKDSIDLDTKPIEDHIIEDQVFEGYTDPSEIIADYEWDKPLTAEEKEKRRKEKEEALRMLTELKSVISVRAVETEKREKVALMKMYPDRILAVKLANRRKDDAPQDSDSGEPDMPYDRVSHIMPNEVKECESCDTNSEISCIKRDFIPCSDVINIMTDHSVNTQIENKNKSLSEELKYSVSIEMTETDSERDKHSIISSQGVRRLRKGNMLDLSDSDLEEYSEDENLHEIEEEQTDLEITPRLGLPLLTLTKGDDNTEGVSEMDSGDCVAMVRLPALTLEERLSHFSGANLGMTSELAEQAVAKSKIMGGLEEMTFGGDVYGECSDDTGDDDDGGD